MISIKFDRKALAEVYEVLLMLKSSDYEKIPKDLIDVIKENRDMEYEVDFDKMETGNMLPDTEKILATLYTYYLSNEKEKILINQMIEVEKQKRYGKDIFLDKKEPKNEKPNANLSLEVIQKKDNLFIQVIKKIRNFFGRK